MRFGITGILAGAFFMGMAATTIIIYGLTPFSVTLLTGISLIVAWVASVINIREKYTIEKAENKNKVKKYTKVFPAIKKPPTREPIYQQREYIDYIEVDYGTYVKTTPERFYELLKKEKQKVVTLQTIQKDPEQQKEINDLYAKIDQLKQELDCLGRNESTYKDMLEREKAFNKQIEALAVRNKELEYRKRIPTNRTVPIMAPIENLDLKKRIKELNIENAAQADTIKQYKKMYEGEKDWAQQLADENECLKKDLIFRKTNGNEYTVEELLREEKINTELRKENNHLQSELNAVKIGTAHLQHQVQMYKTGYGLAEENTQLKKELEEAKKKCEKNAELARKRAELFIQKQIAGFKNHCPKCGADGALKHNKWEIICEACTTTYDSVHGIEHYSGGCIGISPCHKLEKVCKK